MIYARFLYDKRRRRARLELRGHAGTAPKGRDLVCAVLWSLGLLALGALLYGIRLRKGAAE